MQTARNVLAAVMRESSIGIAPAAGAGGTQLRILDSPGLKLTYNSIQSNERRNDMMRPMGRLGGRSVGGSYNMELTLGGATDSFLEAIMRSVWNPETALWTSDGGATETSIQATDASTLTRVGTTSLIDAGFKVGDIITPTNMTNSANDNLRLRVTAVAADALTVAGTPLTADAASEAAVLTRAKKVTNPVSSLTRYSYAVEQYDVDIDLSELFLGCRLTGMNFSYRPNAIATMTLTFVGIDRDILVTGTSPWFTGPSLTSGVPLVADDGAIRYNGEDVTRFTGLDLNMQINATGQPVIGSVTSPDVFDNEITISGQVTGIREDFAKILMLETETEFEISGLFVEPESAPKDFVGFFIPRAKFNDLDAPFMGGDGPKIETLPFMVAPKAAATGYDQTGISWFSSAV